MKLRFESAPAFQTALTILDQPLLAMSWQRDDDTRTVTVDRSDLLHVLQLIEQNPAAVLPVLGTTADEWLIAGSDHHETERAWFSLRRFLFPSYVVFPAGCKFARYQPFSTSDSAVRSAAQSLYSGFIAVQSAPQHRSILFGKLAQWSRLTVRKPSLRLERFPTYGELLGRFHEALALRDFVRAEQAVTELQQRHLITADNSLFLKIQMWARQEAWQQIFEQDAYARLSVLPLPREIRRALITAFHHQVLLPFELHGAYAEALGRFKIERSKLGTMLTGHEPMTDSPIVRLFAYQAVAVQDGEAFDQLSGIANLDSAARTCLDGLRHLLPARTLNSVLPLSERLRTALNERNYDTAMQFANEMPSRPDRVRELLKIAMRYPDGGTIALAAYDELSSTERGELELSEPLLDAYLERVLQISAKGMEFKTWTAWFERLLVAPRDPQVAQSLDPLIEQGGELARAAVQRLSQLIQEILNRHEELLTDRSAVRAIDAVIDAMLKQDHFPVQDYEYNSLYSLLYECLLWREQKGKEQTEKLLRLAWAILDNEPSRLDTIATELKEWFGRPIPALENQLLDAFDLLLAYGARREHLMELYREWLAYLLDRPLAMPWERARQEIWLSIGEWLQPGQDLLKPLEQRLSARVQVDPDPLLRLPNEFRLSIFTLDAPAAERASTVLRKRNPTLDVRICVEKDMNRTVESLARRADAAVVVTTCLTHAISYGIGPLLADKPIYPDSRGSVSIVRAIEEFARNRA